MIKDFESLKVTIASPQQILSWSSGEVRKAETINYRTQRAEVDGLMCEKIFGPTKNFECYCGKYKKIRYKGIVCDKCGVEVTHKRVRRERMGHIKLVCPVSHVWFHHGVPNKMALIMDIPHKKIGSVIYFARYMVVDVDEKGKKKALADIKAAGKDVITSLEKELKDNIKKIEDDFQKEEKKVRKKKEDKNIVEAKIDQLRIKNDQEIAKVREVYARKEERLKEDNRALKELAEKLIVGEIVSEEELITLQENKVSFFKLRMGAEAIKHIMEKMDLSAEISKLKKELETVRSKQKSRKIIQRLRLLEGMKMNDLRPEWLILDVLPVISPELRPIIQLPGGRYATSDLNDLYRRVINRNNRLRRLIELGAPEIILRNEKRMLQESVDALLDNNHRPGNPVLNSRNQPYKSLSDMLRGKQGRFRQNLLGKRVDYSGRAVIVSGPDLLINQCGLPKVVALELFRPLVMREIIARGLAPNIKSAKNYFESKTAEVWDILEEVIKGRPVLLNRAPTLHKQGIQAFYPVLSEGNAIRIHPMICKGFNADFDGDQMAVHVPLSKEAVKEVKERMMPENNVLLMTDGSPVINADKDMIIGCSYLTQEEDTEEKDIKAFSELEDALGAYDLGDISLRQEIKADVKGKVIETTLGRLLFNSLLPKDFEFINQQVTKSDLKGIVAQCLEDYGHERAMKLLDDLKEAGFGYATLSGFSIAMEDFIVSKDRDKFVKEAEEQEERLLDDYNNGLLTEEEKKRLSEQIWMETTDKIAQASWESLGGNNVVFLEESGGYPIKDPERQIAGIKGLILDPTGKIVELPLKSNYKRGLNPFEYFVASRGTRKGLAGVALKTSESGYLTRRLVDVAQDVITTEEDCHTKEGIELRRDDERRLGFGQRIYGRWTTEDVVDPKTGEVLIDEGEEIDAAKADLVEQSGVESVHVRSVLKCKSKFGVCCKCYGYNLGTQKLIEKGMAVGVIAAQAMGEAATQLTLDVKHLGARAGIDITQGLPRVEELFEARLPKGEAVIAGIDGKVKIVQDKESGVVKLRITAGQKEEKVYKIGSKDKRAFKRTKNFKKGEVVCKREGKLDVKAPFEGKASLKKGRIVFKANAFLEEEHELSENDELVVKDGDNVVAGTPLTEGSINPKELTEVADLAAAQDYIIDNVQKVYSIQGIAINDKHVEVVVRQMGRYAKIVNPGDSDLLPGEYHHFLDVLAVNKELRSKDKKPILYKRELLGITMAAVKTESFLSAASFQEQVRVLTDASLLGKVDKLRGLKENVIIGRLVPLGSAVK